MIINRIHETQNLLSLQLVSFLVGLRTYQHPCIDRQVHNESEYLEGLTTGVLISP